MSHAHEMIALVRGDGSAPEMMVVACAIAIEAAKKDGIKIVFVDTPMGWNAYEKYGDTVPRESFKKAVEIGTIFFGGVGDPKLDNTIGIEKPEMKPEARALLALRSTMGLLLNFRPMIYYKSLAHLANVKPETIPNEGVEQVFIRFLLEDSYFGTADLAGGISEDTRIKLGIKAKKDVAGNEEMITELSYYRKETIEKYFRAAFSYARAKGFPLISIDKANVMARYDYWRKIATRIGKEEFPDVPLTHQLVDSANALLFTPAKLHGVIACGNEHGDILSDGAAAALGSMGMMCSSAINPNTDEAMFESGAGTAPTLTGQDKANPLGRILTAAMMLRHIGAITGAQAIEDAVQKVLQQGYRTADLVPPDGSGAWAILGTREMGEKVLSTLTTLTI
ncbi:MAG: isocitrate/isopropylmalate family dehydrogenase [Candidatus Taylorbacteria bacterium]|nr:isocitrate/isopropylmalate family dehydrogenase [Candidatus Taylorbacteria bacterium]